MERTRAQGLELLLHPLTVETFFAEHWNTRAVHVPGQPGKFAGLYDPSRFLHVECFTEIQAASRDAQGRQLEIEIQPEQVHALFEAGMTICADVSADPGVADFLRGLATTLPLAGGAPFARLYASPHDGGFAVHADKFHVFVLQIEGKKEWQFSPAPAIADPLDGVALDARGDPIFSTGGGRAPLARPDVASFTKVVLGEGDCLYLPPGTWHQARAQGRSLALSVSPPRASVFHLVSRALEDLLTPSAQWRRDVLAAPGELGAPGRVAPSVEQLFAARIQELQALLARLDPRTLHRLWKMNGQLGLSALGPPASAAPGRAIEPAVELEHAAGTPFQFLVAPTHLGGDAVFFYASGAEWALPLEALGFVTRLAENRAFKAFAALAWDPKLDWPAVREVLSQLVRAGVLTLKP